jgi:hypothetical protein
VPAQILRRLQPEREARIPSAISVLTTLSGVNASPWRAAE